MKLVEQLRAKSPEKAEAKELLLVDHTKCLLERVKQLREFIEKNSGNINYQLIKGEEFFVALSLAAIFHDLGKINYNSQKLFYKENFKNTEIEKFLRPIKELNIRHEILSSLWASILLDDKNSKMKEWFSKIRTAILLHHCNEYYMQEKDLMEIVVSYQKEIEKYLEFLSQNLNIFENFIRKFLNKIKETSGLEDKTASIVAIPEFKRRVEELLERIKEKDDDISDFAEFYKPDIDENSNKIKKIYNFFIFLGVLRRCDYAASGGVNIEKMTDISQIFKNLEEEIKKIVKKLSDKEGLWQEEILNKIKNDNVVLVAPTGSGKTEFALLWAKRKGRKLIYTLPLRVALNDLFNRFRKKEDKAEQVGYFEPDFVDILHSTSFIEYLKEEKGDSIKIDDKMTSAKLFSSPILLTTPDQVFLTSLKYYGFDKLLSVYPISSIVVDEIQAYNPEMASIIIKTLEMVRNSGGNVLIITATFPPYFRHFINQNNGFEIIDLGEKKNQIKSEIKNYDLKRHRISLIKESLFIYDKNNLVLNTESFNKIKKEINNRKNKNIMILVKNVKKAIKIYENLEKEKNLKNLYLLHSRLIEKEKSRRIKEIKNKLDEIKETRNKNGKISNNERIVLVSTQMVEASVDVDFDILITEISPIDSQIQRWGRVYRNRKENYIESEPNIIIFTEFEKDRGTKAIYDEKNLIKTVEILKNKEIELKKKRVLDYESERKLINSVYTNELLDYYKNGIQKTLDWLSYYSAEKRSEAQRIFRRIAGVQAVVPDLMIKNGNDLKKQFGKIIKDKNNWRKTWDEIINMIKIKNGKIDKWKLKQILYNYSFNIPIFFFEKHKRDIIENNKNKNNFKGFFILKIAENDVDKLKIYGADKIDKLNIELEEINEFSENSVI